MTDEEKDLTRQCVEALDWKWKGKDAGVTSIIDNNLLVNVYIRKTFIARRLFNPLHDDAQTINIMIERKLSLQYDSDLDMWICYDPDTELFRGDKDWRIAIVRAVIALKGVNDG